MANNNFFDRKTLILLILLIICAIRPVLAERVIDIHNFDLVLPAAGGREEIMDDEIELKVGYIKVDLKTKDGDKYDVRLKYSKDYLQSTKILAAKKGLNGKGESSTVYFIPKKGTCPGKEDECVRVPAIQGISTNTHLIDSKRIFYGVEVYNGSAFGGRLKVKGSFKFINYDEEDKVD